MIGVKDLATITQLSAASETTTTAATKKNELRRNVAHRSLWRDAARRFSQNKLAVTGLVVISLLILIAIIGPYLSPYDYTRQDYMAVRQPPSAKHWLGTDALGRDHLSRLMMGGRTAFLLSIWVTAISTVLGITFGAMSGFLGGWVDALIMRVVDTLMSFPHLLLALFLAGAIRPPVAKWLANYSIFNNNSYLVDYVIVFGALSAVGWAGLARLVRAQVMTLQTREFVHAAHAQGASKWRIMFRHIMPNALTPVMVSVTAGMADVMLLESSLSFFGIGVRPPGASWGSIIGENLTTWQYAPHLLAAPAITIALAALAFNFIGDGLNDALDPRRQR